MSDIEKMDSTEHGNANDTPRATTGSTQNVVVVKGEQDEQQQQQQSLEVEVTSNGGDQQAVDGPAKEEKMDASSVKSDQQQVLIGKFHI
jgi:hypothetical protein